MKNYIVSIALALITGCIGFLSGKYFERSGKIETPLDTADKTKELRLGGYKLINPLLECDNFHPSKMLSSLELHKKVKSFIENAKSTGRASHISFYYRDLTNGPWIGIGEKEDFSPASLLKVPVMIAVFKKAENDPDFLKKKIKYNEDLNKGIIPNIKDSVLKIGNSYSVEELINFMIVHSDNNARHLLFQNIEQTFITRVFTDIGIDMTYFDDSKDFMSVKTYSSFFRILYNATYLNKENSEKALQILTNSSFRQGLPAKLPDNVLVAHKFGERGYTNSEIKQLHDCGIVYKGNSPYLICVMTKGTNTRELSNIIAELSSLVYLMN